MHLGLKETLEPKDPNRGCRQAQGMLIMIQGHRHEPLLTLGGGSPKVLIRQGLSTPSPSLDALSAIDKDPADLGARDTRSLQCSGSYSSSRKLGYGPLCLARWPPESSNDGLASLSHTSIRMSPQVAMSPRTQLCTLTHQFCSAWRTPPSPSERSYKTFESAAHILGSHQLRVPGFCGWRGSDSS